MDHSDDRSRSDTIDADTASARDIDKILALLKRALSSTPLTDDYTVSPHWHEHAPTVGEGERLLHFDDARIANLSLFYRR